MNGWLHIQRFDIENGMDANDHEMQNGSNGYQHDWARTVPVAWEYEKTSRLDLHHLPDDKAVFACQKCSEVVALQDELVSKAFNGRSGRAYLLNSTINTSLGKREERKLLTGLHTVADLLCASCNTSLGWMYIRAPNGEQRYKEGRYILEAAKIVKENNW